MTLQDASLQRPPTPTTPPSLNATLRVEGRSYNSLTQALDDLPAISSSVQSKTGWPLNLSDTTLAVVSLQELSRRSIVDDLRRTGVPAATEASVLTAASNRLETFAYFHGVIAVYLPKEGAILMNESRVQRASQDAVKSALHHELTHVAQHQKYPAFIDALDKAARQYRLWSNHGSDFPRDEQARQSQKFLDQVQARMSLLEGQARALQGMFEQDLQLVPEGKLGVFDLALGLTHRFMAGMRHKVGQYVQGEEIFKRIYDLGLHEVDELFKSPRYTDLVFGRENPQYTRPR